MVMLIKYIEFLRLKKEILTCKKMLECHALGITFQKCLKVWQSKAVLKVVKVIVVLSSVNIAKRDGIV